MSDMSIIVNEGPLTADDNAVYFTNEVTVTVEYLNSEERPHESVKYATFVPSNGRQRGRLCKVPFERVVMITEIK